MALGYLMRTVVGLILLSFLQIAHAASAVHKCVINGSVTFQSSPCPSDKPARRPTLDELNAERKKRHAITAASAASATTASSSSGPRPAEIQPIPAARDTGFRCDGRQHCSQMRSCSEAKYFLSNCPGVKMDGDRDGVPCEEQWCTSPLSK